MRTPDLSSCSWEIWDKMANFGGGGDDIPSRFPSTNRRRRAATPVGFPSGGAEYPKLKISRLPCQLMGAKNAIDYTI